MFEKYRGLILTTIFIAAIIYFGHRTEQNVNRSIHKIISEERAAEKIIHDNTEHEVEHATVDNNFQNEASSLSHELSPSQVEEIVRNYLTKNPQIIAEALDNFQHIKMEEVTKQVQERISSHKEDLENKSSPTLGNINGSSTIVMFYDYSCGFCKQSSEAIEALISSNKDVKIILKAYPILGNESEFLARLSLAVYDKAPAKFKAIHDEFISNKTFNKEDLNRLFKEHELDYYSLESYSESNDVITQIKNNLNLAKELNINGVPAFVINGNYYPGFLSTEQLLEKTKKLTQVETKDDKDTLPHGESSIQAKESDVINEQ